MKKVIRKGLISVLTFLLIATTICQYPINIMASEINVALNKPVEVSSLDPLSQNQQNGENAVDGDSNTRWTSNRAAGYDLHEYIIVDLQGSYLLDRVEVDWEGACAKEYTVQVSTDGKNYQTVATITDGKQENRVIHFEKVKANYLKLDFTKKVSNRYGYSIWELRAYGEKTDNINVVQNEDVTVSASGTESNSTVLTADKAIDGKTGQNETRWSGAKTDNQWLIVDLGRIYTLKQINIDFFREAADYTIEVSKDGVNYHEILKVEDNTLINIENVREIIFDAQEVQYIKFNQTKMFVSDSNKQKYSASIYEIEAYEEVISQPTSQSAKSVLSYIEQNGFEIPDNSGEKIIFLKDITDKFDVEIYGTDYKPIISMKGIYNQPLVDKKVHLMYKVTNKENKDDVAISTKDNSVLIEGKYKDNGVNKAPKVIPTLQEWYGGEGKYQLSNHSKIIYSSAKLKDKAQLIADYLKNLVNKNISIQEGNNPQAGDIYLTLNNDDSITSLEEEGYLLDIKDYVTVKSSTLNGVFYGGVTLVQALYLEKDTLAVNQGIARDYPKYEVRSIALDIARSEIKLDYIKEITEVLPFFKINEIVLHINDDRGDVISDKDIGSEENKKQTKELSSFRIENDKGIGSHTYQISKEDYIQYQKDASKYGVSVITELDTPAHSAVFSLLDEMKDNMYDVRHLEILQDPTVTNVNDVQLNKKTMNFIDELTEELIGNYPGEKVIQNPVFHFGTDEYKTSAVYSEAMQQYINHYVDFIQERGYEARAWASTDGSSGFKGYKTPQNKEVTYYLWAPYWADVKKTLANGNPIINCSGSSLYIVPGGNNGYSNYLNLSKLYNSWSVNDITTTRGSGGATIPISHPQLRGASVVLWNDDGFLLDGVSDFDLYDRLKEGFPIIAERTWYGEKTEDQDYDDFQSVSDYLLKKGPISNPSRYVESIDDKIAEYDFESIDGTYVKDSSDNTYDANIHKLSVGKGRIGKGLILDGQSYLQLPFDTVGFPASVSLDLYVEKSTNKDATLFSGKDGSIHLNQKDKNGQYTDKLGYERDGYTYIFDYKIPTDKWVNITITTDRNGTKLYVNNQFKSYGKRTEFGTYVKKDLSTTMVLPTEKIGQGIVGKIDNLVIYDSSLNIAQPENIAPQAVKSTTSNDFNEQFTGKNAIDNNKTTRWATTNDTKGVWLELSFDKEVQINKTNIIEYNAANNYINRYNIEYWNGKEWVVAFTQEIANSEKTSVSGVSNGKSFGGEFDTITTSKVRLNIIDASRPSIYEFELYYIPDEIDMVAFDEAIEKAERFEANLFKNYVEVKKALDEAKKVLANKAVTQEEIDTVTTKLNKAIESLEYKDADYSEVEKALSLIPNDLSIYTEESVKVLENVKSAVVKNLNITQQSKVNEMAKAIREAIIALEEKQVVVPKVDKSKLIDLIEKAEKIDLNLYESQSVEEIINALLNAKKVNAEEATQQEVDTAFEILNKAILGLKIKEDNSGVSTKPTEPEEIDKDVLGNMVDIKEQEIVDKKGNNQKINGAKTNDSMVIMPYVILAICAAGTYITIKKREF